MKKTWLLCLFLFCLLAVPVQGQSVPSQVTNPTTLADCGLPAATSQFTSISSITTFELIADCTYDRWSAAALQAILYISSGTFTINGNGFSIKGPPHTYVAFVSGSNSVLNLNNVIFRESGVRQTVVVQNGARLNGSNIIFRDTSSISQIHAAGGGQATLRNVQFLNNRQANPGGAGFGSAVTAYNGGTVTIINGIFRGNRNHSGQADVVSSDAIGAHVRLQGCITFENNVQSDGTTAANPYMRYATTGSVMGQVTDDRTGACPAAGFSYWLALTPQKKSKKTATPRPSATFRPLATTCIDLNLATGIVVHATYGLDSGVQCQRLGGGGIGLQSIVEAGFIDAVDVWGYVEQGVEVCFPQAGELLFLDARTMPRAVAPLAATVVNGMTCGAIDSPGSIVLMPPP